MQKIPHRWSIASLVLVWTLAGPIIGDALCILMRRSDMFDWRD